MAEILQKGICKGGGLCYAEKKEGDNQTADGQDPGKMVRPNKKRKSRRHKEGMKTIFRIFQDAKKYWLRLSLGFFFLIVATVAGFYTPWAMRQLTSLATEGSADFAVEALRVGVLLLGTTALKALGTSASGYLNHSASLLYVADLRARVYSRLQQMSLRYFHKSRTGELTARVVSDAMDAELLIARVLPEVLMNLFTFAGVGILIFTINAKLAIISLVSLPFLLATVLWQTRHLSPIWKKSSEARGLLSGMVQDNLSGIKEIQSFNQQEHEEARIGDLALHHSKIYLKARFFFETSYPLIAFFTALGSVAVIVFGGRMVARGEVRIADIVGIVMYLSMFYKPLDSISRLIDMGGKALAGCKRVFEILDKEPDIEEAPKPKPLGRVKGEIEFRHVSFAYQPGFPVLEDFNLKIAPGQTIALVGTTGVGKTTVASLVNRFYDPQDGTIYLDGIDIKEVALQDLRDNFSMVLQDTFLFNGAVYDNIAYGKKDAARQDVIAAAQAANAHGFIEELEQGYDTIIGERGVRLSGGQKQRLSIARAILRNTPILILDEATSSLDSETEREIQEALEEIAKGRTTLIIAHRLSTVIGADRIVVLEGAGIAESGRHEELLRSDGPYAKLYGAQMH